VPTTGNIQQLLADVKQQIKLTTTVNYPYLIDEDEKF
jgi:hypothetical protein